MMARATAEVDIGAIKRNCKRFRQAAPKSLLCVVVKADGYGHGMIEIAGAALEGGASWLAVASSSEGLSLRSAGLESPILVMGVVEETDVQPLVSASCDFAVWTEEALAWAQEASGVSRVHVKYDSGMGRLGTRDPDLALELAQHAERGEGTELVGVMTHFATADEADLGFLGEQNLLFSDFAGRVKAFAPGVIAHAANSAATLRLTDSHHDMVRCGVGVYGLDPLQLDPRDHGLEPAMSFKSWIGKLTLTHPGQTVGYGRNFNPIAPTWVATVPVGYADGVRRSLGGRGECLVGGRRVPIIGNVSMDNIALDLGPSAVDAVGDTVILLGADGNERALVEHWADACGTINYEIVTGIGGRTEFQYLESQ